MHVTDGVPAQVMIQPLQGFTDDGGAEMADVQGLCHVCAAVVHHDGLAGTGFLHAEIRSGTHLFQIVRQEMAGELQIDEAGHDGLAHIVVFLAQLLCHSLCNLNGGASILLCRSQCAVALIFTQVRPIGNRYPAKGGVIPRRLKCLLHFFCNNIQNFFHILLLV